MGDACIPSLAPYGLDRVPGRDDARPEWRAEWKAWRERVVVLRDQIHERAERDLQFRQTELAICKDDPAYWLCVYGFIEEPRGEADDFDGSAEGDSEEPESTIKPFIPMAFQVELLQWFVQVCRLRRQHDGYVSKARGLGASWTFCAGALWGWLFTSWRGGFISAKQDRVDKPHDLDTLFGKVDFLLNWLPKWMHPAGLRLDHGNGGHRMKLMLKHPSTTAQIVGDSTTGDAFRGGRATWILYDEAAFQDQFDDAWTSGGGTSWHRFGLSTESFSKGRAWYDRWQSAKKNSQGRVPPVVIELDWQENPLYSPAYIQAERQRHEDEGNIEGFMREYERNPYAGSGAWVYPTAEGIARIHRPYTGSEQLVVGIDPGHADDTAIVWGMPTYEDGKRGVHWLGCYERNLAPVEWYAHLLTGIAPEPGDLCYDLTFGAREETLMRFFHDLPRAGGRVAFVMDPAGQQRHNGLSFYDLLYQHTTNLRRRAFGPEERGIAPIASYLKKNNLHLHDERRHATRTLLPFTTVENTQSGERIIKCLTTYAFNEPGKNAVGEPKPIHSDVSHVVSAIEYANVAMHYGITDARVERAPKTHDRRMKRAA